jgi:TatD DNase family protein
MKYIDTHTHTYLPEFNDDRDKVVGRALEAGVGKLLLPNIDTDSVEPMLSMAARFPGICYPMMGLHPTSVKADYLEQLDRLESLWQEMDFIAVGEIGLDFYWDKTYIEEQVYSLRRQIIFALEKDLPVVIHSRESFPRLFKVLDEFRGSGLKGVLHAFTGSTADAEKAVGMGFLLGIGGIVTFKKSGLDEVVKFAGTGNVVLETDSPYLAPVPHRGRRNESSYIPLISRKLSEILDMEEEEVAKKTSGNAVRLFKL